MATPTLADPDGPTGKLCTWVERVQLRDIPEDIRTRAKYLILDGLACALIGAHLPWSETAARTVLDMEFSSSSSSGGGATIIGWDKKVSPVSAALLNSTFLQGFQLDDWHSESPLHSNSLVLPALLAAAEHVSQSHLDSGRVCTGEDLLLGTIVGYEVGPRVGLGLHGGHMLTMGWHSGAVFGPSPVAASVSKLLKLPAGQIEDALGIACTQAGGLMSAQYESEVKRMQHGFAARNGLFAALLARQGYVGIKKVYERSYGGFLAQFSLGMDKDPRYMADEVAKGLGQEWKTDGVRVKPYAAMAGTHSTVDCVMGLQREHPQDMKNLTAVKDIKIEMGEVAFHHGGWKAERPLTATGAQMSNAYVGATQIVDGRVLAAQFRHDCLERNEVWALVDRTTCELNHTFPVSQQRVTITFADGRPPLTHQVEAARGVKPPLPNDEILEKWRRLAREVADENRVAEIEKMVLGLEDCVDIAALGALLSPLTRNPIA